MKATRLYRERDVAALDGIDGHLGEVSTSGREPACPAPMIAVLTSLAVLVAWLA